MVRNTLLTALFIELIFHFLSENQNRRLAKWIFLHFLSQFDIFFSKISPDCVPYLLKILTMTDFVLNFKISTAHDFSFLSAPVYFEL